MDKKAKEFRERIKLDTHFFRKCRKQMEAYEKDYESRIKLPKEIEEDNIKRQSKAGEQWKILSEFERI